MKRIFIDGLMVDGISTADMVFPASVAGAIGDIVVGKPCGAQFGVRAPTELIPAAFEGIEGIEVAYGPDIEFARRLIAHGYEGDEIHQPVVRFHFDEAVGIHVSPGFGGGQLNRAIADPEAIRLGYGLQGRIHRQAAENGVGQSRIRYMGDGDGMFAIETQVVFEEAEIREQIRKGSIIAAAGSFIECLGDGETPDPIEVAVIAGFHFDPVDGIVAVQGDIHAAFEQQVLRVAGDKIEPDEAYPLLQYGVPDEIFVKIGREFGNRAHELQRKHQHRIVVYREVLVEPVDDGADAPHVDIFPEVHALMAEDHRFFPGRAGAGIVAGDRLFEVGRHQ